MACFLVVYHGISHKSFVFSSYTHEPLGKCVCKENASDEWDILCITILYHVIENMWHYIIDVVHYGKYRRIYNSFPTFRSPVFSMAWYKIMFITILKSQTETKDLYLFHILCDWIFTQKFRTLCCIKSLSIF